MENGEMKLGHFSKAKWSKPTFDREEQRTLGKACYGLLMPEENNDDEEEEEGEI